MTLKDLWELLTETWNAWSTHKASQSGATLAYDTPGILARCVVLHGALPRAEQHGVGLWPGRFARAPVWRGIYGGVRPPPRVTCR